MEPECPADPPPGGEGSGSDSNNTNGATGSGDGDPHVRTFNGKRFDMHGLGQCVVASHDSLIVHIRTHPVYRSITSLSAVALGFGDHTMMIEAAALHIDGKPVTAELIEPDGVRILNKNHIVILQFENSQLVRAVNSWQWVLDLSVRNPARGEWTGMLGNADDDSENEMVTREGHLIEGKPTFEQVHRNFSETWRVSQNESLFLCGDGESTETFTDRNMPHAPFTAADFPAEHHKQAARMCRAAEIEDAEVFQNCVLDDSLLGQLGNASVPGQLGTLRSAVRVDRAEAFMSRKTDNLGKRVPASQESRTPTNKIVTPGTKDSGADPDSWLVTGVELFGDPKIRAGITCAPGGKPGRLWGVLDAYAMESSVCTAAVHHGVITLAKGAT